MKGFPTRQQVERIKEKYPPGTKIRMESMSDPYAPIPSGVEGIVDFVWTISALCIAALKMDAVLVLLLARIAFQLLDRKKEHGFNNEMEAARCKTSHRFSIFQVPLSNQKQKFFYPPAVCEEL